MQTRQEGSIRQVLVLMAVFALVMTFSSRAIAQDEMPVPRAQMFFGYSYLNPGDNSNIPGFAPGIARGFNIAVDYNVNKWFGLTFDTSGHFHDNVRAGNILGGPTVSLRRDKFVYFAHALFGVQRGSPLGFSENDFAAGVGGGVDVRIIPLLSWRVVQLDYIHANHDFAPVAVGDTWNSIRLSMGLVFNLGSLAKPTPPSAACSASPGEVMEGEGVTVTASPTGFNPKHTLAYNWTSNGGKISGTDATGKIDTTGMTNGNYSATAQISDPKSKNMTASCSANFAVKEKPKNPPQISCSANPQTVQSGSPSTISCTCTSPDGAQLQPLAWQASQGKIAGEGMSATLDTAGLESGSVNVTTTCTDARGLSSSANTNVNVEKPVVINPSKINECAFPNKVKPARVDNTCKAALDDVALRLQREADAKAVIVGMMDAKEKKNTAAERATNTKGYLVNEKQIDATRLETRTGSDGGQRVEIWLVPAGSTAFDQPGTTVVNAPMPKPEKKGTKKAAKKPAQ
jgi:hypothetical protein